MAFYPNPYYGQVPGAPQGLNTWLGNQFVMSGMPPPPVAPLPPVTTAATPTPQDVATQQGAGLLAPTTGAGGAQPGGGGPGTGPGGIGGASGGGQDTTTSGYPGVYAQAPGELNSQFGNVMGTAGMAVPVPGAGTALGALGGFIDASRYNGINAQYGVPGTVNPWGSAAHEILSGIGVPFTDWDLANLFDVPSARARHLGLVDDAGYIGRDAMGYGALAANQPVGTPTRESGQFASYPAGFIESGLQPSHGLPTEQAAQLNLDVERTIAGNPDVFGARAQDVSLSQDVDRTIAANPDVFGSNSQSVDPGSAGSGFGDPWGGGWFAKGGRVGPPPGRFAAGGAVAPPAANITPAQFGLLRGIDPPGPDDQIAAVQSGEGVLTRKALARYPGLLDAANAGKIPAKKLTGLLAAKPSRRPR